MAIDVFVREVGLRDGLQSIPRVRLNTEQKLEWIREAYDAGQREIIAKLKAVPLALGQDGPHHALAVQTNECIQRLIRMWCD